jgi:hypothetical protein
MVPPTHSSSKAMPVTIAERGSEHNVTYFP